MSSLSAILTYATQNLKWISENPALDLKKLKENPGRDRVLSEQEITRLFKASKESQSPYLYCIILISLTTGARQGEILNLEWRHVDFENQIAYIKESKNGKPRSIALCKPVIEELKLLYQNRNPQKPLVSHRTDAVFLLDNAADIAAIFVFRKLMGKKKQLFVTYKAHLTGDFFNTGNLNPLPFLNSLHIVRRLL